MRKANRKNRKNTRRNWRRNNMMGGGNANSTGPAPVTYNLAGSAPSNMNLAQGQQYLSYHMNQHGGEAPLSQITDSTLPQELHASARILPLDGYFADIRGLRDPNQMGAGRRRRNTRRNRKNTRKNRKGNRKNTRRCWSRRNNMMGGRPTMAPRPPRPHTPPRYPIKRPNKNNRRSRRNNMMGGGAVYNPDPASTSAPGLLLDPGLEAKAVRGMNPEWYLAEDPNSFTPKA